MGDPSKQVKAIFDRALEFASSTERNSFLDQACAHDAELRSQVDDLLRAYEQAGSFLESPPAGVAVTLDQPCIERAGTQIGPYKLQQQIGEGGFGEVYVAEQHTPVRRKVALKIVKPGMDTREASTTARPSS